MYVIVKALDVGHPQIRITFAETERKALEFVEKMLTPSFDKMDDANVWADWSCTIEIREVPTSADI